MIFFALKSNSSSVQVLQSFQTNSTEKYACHYVTKPVLTSEIEVLCRIYSSVPNVLKIKHKNRKCKFISVSESAPKKVGCAANLLASTWMLTVKTMLFFNIFGCKKIFLQKKRKIWFVFEIGWILCNLHPCLALHFFHP